MDVGCVHVGCERCDERVEYVGGEGYQWWEGGVGWGEGDLEAEDCWGVRSCSNKLALCIFELGKGCRMPFRTNITPDHNVGSPGVRDMNTPCGQAYLRLELGFGQ